MKTIVIAIGGNSLIKDAKHMSVPDQYAAVVATARHVADLLVRGYRIVITHGNGPQVGFILLRSEYSRGILHQVPLDSIVADTQGALGYQIQQALDNEFRRRGLMKSVASIVTQTLVDSNDPAFANPSKPIGQFYTRAEAEDRMRVEKWAMVEDAGRGWRRVVASPKPVRIIESEAVRHLVKDGYVVIAAGGGGIPVAADEHGMLRGVAAVVDKDLASAVLAGAIGADLLVIATAVEKVCLNFGKPGQRALDRMTAAEARQYMGEGHFHAGSMLPKVEACLQFLEQGGHEALITSPQALPAALDGTTGTWLAGG
ncbi:MAG TPA: carbamate kinase [Candidatus Paceibacterota bacterium]|nr:carbamate kinase [Verrucomicrobiota bacterium]HSA09818.1 carbamate kinase [Candidatus Paceibacterota bacterium]